MSGFGVAMTSGVAEQTPLLVDFRLEEELESELESEPRLSDEPVALVVIEPWRRTRALETIVIVVGACDFCAYENFAARFFRLPSDGLFLYPSAAERGGDDVVDVAGVAHDGMSGVLWARRSEKIWASVLSMREEPRRRFEKVAAPRDRGDCCCEVVQSFSASSGDMLPNESDRPLMGSMLLAIRLSKRITPLRSPTSIALIYPNSDDCKTRTLLARFAILWSFSQRFSFRRLGWGRCGFVSRLFFVVFDRCHAQHLG